ncbi:MAG: hypothetical protein M3238_04050 [Actinomycetota bacterium]|nr:hypothetical protein [Actinomycetota bacterium]
MRRILLTVVTATLLTITVAAPALAQPRDPFRPLVGGPGTTTSTTTTTGEIDSTTTVPAGSERLAETGSDTQSWFGLAYALIALGGGALVLARMRAPTRLPGARNSS